MDNENEQDVDLNNDIEGEDVELDLDTDTDKKEEKPKRTPEEQLKYLEGRTQRLRKKLGLTEPRKAKEGKESKTGELGDSELNYLDIKGITEDEDIDIVQKFIAKTGQTVRQALKDDYVQTKLNGLKAKREVENATPSSTKRSGSQASDLITATERFKQTGKLPEDFDLKTQVLNKLSEDKASIVPWRR